MTKEWRSILVQNTITLAIVIIGAIVTVSMTSNYNDDTTIKEKIDAKVDRVEYVERVLRVDSDLDKKVDKEVFISYLENQKNNQSALVEIQRDIKTILKEMK